MLHETPDNLLHVKSRNPVPIQNGKGITVKSLEGTVWVTLENDTRDIVLGPGETFTIDRQGLTLVAALGDATVSFCAPPASRMRFSRDRAGDAILPVAA